MKRFVLTSLSFGFLYVTTVGCVQDILRKEQCSSLRQVQRTILPRRIRYYFSDKGSKLNLEIEQWMKSAIVSDENRPVQIEERVYSGHGEKKWLITPANYGQKSLKSFQTGVSLRHRFYWNLLYYRNFKHRHLEFHVTFRHMGWPVKGTCNRQIVVKVVLCLNPKTNQVKIHHSKVHWFTFPVNNEVRPIVLFQNRPAFLSGSRALSVVVGPSDTSRIAHLKANNANLEKEETVIARK